MRYRSVVAAAAALLALGCTDSSSPDLTDIVLDFCSSDVPAFVAFQTDDGAWTRLTPDASSSVTLQAGKTVGLAIVWDYVDYSFTDIVYVSRAELQAESGAQCVEPFGDNTLHGSFAGFGTSPQGRAYIRAAVGLANADVPDFDMTDVADGPFDLAALRVGEPATIILRHGLDLGDGATIPLLDFESSEAFTTTSAAVTVGGSPSDAGVFSGLLMSDWTSLTLSGDFYAGPATVEVVPVGKLGPSDLGYVEAYEISSTAVRATVLYQRNLSSVSLTLPPFVSTPTFSVVATTPFVRMRGMLPAQAALPDVVYLDWWQDQPEVQVVVTRGYLGETPDTWTAEIPDLSAVAGFQSAWMLANGQPTSTFVEADFGAPYFGVRRELVPDGTVESWSYDVDVASVESPATAPSLRAGRRPPNGWSIRARRQREALRQP